MIQHLLIMELEQFHAIILFLLILFMLMGDGFGCAKIYTDGAILLSSIMTIQILLGSLWKNRDQKRARRYWIVSFGLMTFACLANAAAAVVRILTPELANEQGTFLKSVMLVFFVGLFVPIIFQKAIFSAMYEDIREQRELAKQEWSRKEEEYTETSNEVLLESE